MTVEQALRTKVVKVVSHVKSRESIVPLVGGLEKEGFMMVCTSVLYQTCHIEQ